MGAATQTPVPGTLPNLRDPAVSTQDRIRAMQEVLAATTPAPSKPDTPAPTWSPDSPPEILIMKERWFVLRGGEVQILVPGQYVRVGVDCTEKEAADFKGARLAIARPNITLRVLADEWSADVGGVRCAGRRGELISYSGFNEDALLLQAQELGQIEVLHHITRQSSLHGIPACPAAGKPTPAPKRDPMLDYPQVPSVHPGMRRQ